MDFPSLAAFTYFDHFRNLTKMIVYIDILSFAGISRAMYKESFYRGKKQANRVKKEAE